MRPKRKRQKDNNEWLRCVGSVSFFHRTHLLRFVIVSIAHHWDFHTYFSFVRNSRNLLTANHTKYIIIFTYASSRIHMHIHSFLISVSLPLALHMDSENVKLIGVICKLIWEKCVNICFLSLFLG